MTTPPSIWAITAFFNPAGYRTKRSHFERFAAGLRRQGLALLVAALDRTDGQGELALDSADQILRVRSDAILWHKERLLNLALAALPPACDKVVWLDADVLFERDDWVAATAAALDDVPIVQPFSQACWLPQGATSAAGLEFAPGLGAGHFMPGMGRVMSRKTNHEEALASYFTHGHTGFAWAARRALLETTGFFDELILGGADTAMARAMYSAAPFHDIELSPALASSLQRWREAFHDQVRGRVGHIGGRLLHLWHGELQARRYTERAQILVEHNFDPRADIALDEQGCWRWASDKPELHGAVAAYFSSRREDG